jgi:N-acyl-D-aspartate/D-glutamate deacylase
MTRTVFTGGRVFDGTGAAISDADVAIEDGRIVDVGPGLDGDDAINCNDKALLPGSVRLSRASRVASRGPR